MLTSETLDTLIGVVTVVLVLGLLVETILAAFKKLLKLKSRELEESLIDLFETALSPQDFGRSITIAFVQGKAVATLPNHRFKTGERKQIAGATPEAYNGVFEIAVVDKDSFSYSIADPGQPAAGTIVVQSHSEVLDRFRSPLLQLFRREHPSAQASPEVRVLFEAVMSQFRDIGRVSSAGRLMLSSIAKDDLVKVLKRVAPGTMLPHTLLVLQEVCDEVGKVSDALAAIRPEMLSGANSARLGQVSEALTPLINDIATLVDGNRKLRANCIIGDVMALRGLDTEKVLQLVGEIHGTVAEELAAARAQTPPGGNVAELVAVDASLKALVAAISKLQGKLDAALARLRQKVTQVENWFETVMHSFEERYAQGMKTYAFIVSLAVAITLNANIFNVYRDIATNDQMRAAIGATGTDVMKTYENRLAAIAAVPPDRQTALRQELQASEQAVKEAVAKYSQFGFVPLSSEWAALRDKASRNDFAALISHVLFLLAGWILMAAILSAGAPFWHDVLESLFGMKNVLRKKGEIQNIEQAAGTGQPRT